MEKACKQGSESIPQERTEKAGGRSMTVGDIIKVTELSTGNTYEARIVSGSPSAGLYSDDHGNSWWASGVQWTPIIGPHQTAPKTHTCEVIKTAEQVRKEFFEDRLRKVATKIYYEVRAEKYTIEDIINEIKDFYR